MLHVTGHGDFNTDSLKGEIIENLSAYIEENGSGVFAVFIRWRNTYNFYDGDTEAPNKHKALFTIDLQDATEREKNLVFETIMDVLL